MKIIIKLINILPNHIEEYICKKIRLNSFGPTPDQTLYKIQLSIKNRFNYNIKLNVINSIKSTYIK